MKAKAYASISMAARISAVSFLSAVMVFCASGSVAAGGLHFTRTWQILHDNEMPTDAIKMAVMKCESVATYVDMPGNLNGAWIVEGPTKRGRKIIVNLLINGDLKKTCKVKVTRKRVFKTCTCE